MDKASTSFLPSAVSVSSSFSRNLNPGWSSVHRKTAKQFVKVQLMRFSLTSWRHCDNPRNTRLLISGFILHDQIPNSLRVVMCATESPSSLGILLLKKMLSFSILSQCWSSLARCLNKPLDNLQPHISTLLVFALKLTVWRNSSAAAVFESSCPFLFLFRLICTFFRCKAWMNTSWCCFMHLSTVIIRTNMSALFATIVHWATGISPNRMRLMSWRVGRFWP